MAYGFLRKVFEIFERHCTPIDMITTSEVAVSLTVDCTQNLDAIEEELKELGTIEVGKDNSIVCVVGNMEHSQSGLIASIMRSIDTIPVKMVSYGASHRSVAMLISTKDKIGTLRLLNKHLFENAM